MKATHKLLDLFLLPAFLLALPLAGAGPVRAAEGWQEKMLFNPSASQLDLEKRGRIMIYDGMTSTQVARALDTQFERIQSMMFVRTVVTDAEGEIQRDQETGTVVVEDDGC